MPSDDLAIALEESTSVNDPQDTIVIDGITLQRTGRETRTWTYVPRAPTLETDSAGKPALRIVEAGGVAFLQCTARVALRDDDRAALLQKLRHIRPDAEAIEAAPLTVHRVALEAFANGVWSSAAESAGSGMPPWTAALAVMLPAGALAALKAAVAGESGRARLAASLTVAGTPERVHRIREAGSVHVRTSAGETSSSFAVEIDGSTAARAPVRLELTADIADLLRDTQPRA
jgi:hypothetical protein